MPKHMPANKTITLDALEYQIAGQQNYEWFGHDAVCTGDGKLVIGAPGHRSNNRE
jgi:hypothetical protein